MPIRIQRRRTRGWRLPKNTVCVTRGRYFKFGNPFKEATNAESIFRFREALILELAAINLGRQPFNLQMRYIATHLGELKGKDLACFCPLKDSRGDDVPCHADVLLEYANR